MKKWISILLSVAILSSFIPNVVFAESKTHFNDITGDEYYAKAAEQLSDLKIIEGYSDGSFSADKPITRAEMAAIICRVINKDKDVAKGKTDFYDVQPNHWASGYINIAANENIINGDGNGKFRPEDNVKYEEALKMTVCALGYGNDINIDKTDWSAGYIKAAKEKGITDDLKGSKGTASMRGDVALMIYNGLTIGLLAPEISLKEGNYTGKQSVTLTTETKDAEIYYTVDGSEPSVSSSKYINPIDITKTTTLKAISVIKGGLVSDVSSAAYTIKTISGGGGGGGSSSSSSKEPDLKFKDLSDTETNNIDKETLTISGTSKAYSGKIKEVSYELRYSMEEKAGVKGEAEGTTTWSIKDLPLNVGTNFLTVTVTDTKNNKTEKEVTINRLSTEITLSDNVILYDEAKTSEAASDIVDYYVNDMNTPDNTYDDVIEVVFKETSDIVSSIKSGNIVPGNVLMLQPCEALYLGFNGVMISNGEADNERYPADQYELVTFRSADFTDIFTGDVSLSYELADVENPLAFAYFPTGAEVYTMDDSGNKESVLYNNIDEQTSLYATDGYGDDSVSQKIEGAGFQKNALSYMMSDALNISGGLTSDNGMNIGIKFKDTVIYDKDGKDVLEDGTKSENDQFKFGGSISYNHFKVDAGLEWHPNFNPFNLDLLPQQVMGKYSYTEEVDFHANWTGEQDLKDIVKTANKALKNDFENNKQFMGMTLSGVDMSDSIILGAFGLQIAPTGVAPVVGIKNAQYSSVFTPLSAILVIMPVLDVSGEISAKVGFAYKYSAYNEKGINMQKKDFVGSYGSLADNKGQASIELPFDRSLEIYNICSKSKDDKESEPVWSITLSGDGKAEEQIGLGADIGIMIAGIIPASAELKVYEKAGVNLHGEIKVDNESGFTLDGSASADAKIGVMAGAHFKLAASTALFSPEIKADKEWDKVLWEIGMTTAKVEGTAYKADTDSDDTNNVKLDGVTVKMLRTDQLDAVSETTLTDAEGNYVFENVLPGKYKMTFTKDGYDVYTIEQFTMSSSDSKQNAYLTPEAHATLSGKVTEADSDTDITNNIPLENVSVTAKLANSGINVVKTVSTDENGNYSIDDLPIGMYNVKFVKDGYISTTQTFEVAEGVANYYNTIIEAISNENSGNGTASGTIFDYLTGQGIEGLTLKIRSGVGIKQGNFAASIISGEDGKYVTPELPAGLYTVEIADNRTDVEDNYNTNYFNIKILGNMNIANQNGAVGTALADEQLRIVLRWGENPLDLDSHLIGMLSNDRKFHIYYQNFDYEQDGVIVANLDLDDTTSWGPETTTIYNPEHGKYKFCVHDYSNKYNSENIELANSGAVVQIFRGVSAVPEYELYVPQGVGTVWNVFEYNSETGIISIINTITHEENPSNVGLLSNDEASENNGVPTMKIFDDVYIELTK